MPHLIINRTLEGFWSFGLSEIGNHMLLHFQEQYN